MIIKIGPYKIPVKYVKNLMLDDKPCFGLFSNDPHTIYIDASLKASPEEHLTTLLHECIEALDSIYNIKLKHDQIMILAPVLAGLIKQNKSLRSFFA